MSIIDRLKSMAGKHSDKVSKGLDQAARTADKRTGGKYADKIGTAKDRAKGYISDQGEQHRGGEGRQRRDPGTGLGDRGGQGPA